jgi:YihY family inner membrane protein
MLGDVTLTQRLDDFQQRRRWAGFPLAVVYKFADDQGGYLAALITYYGFLSVFPLLLLLSSILGILLENHADWRQEILDSALRQFPVIGEQLGAPGGLSGSTTAVIIGLIGSLYGALGVGQAAQNAMNTMWAVPRNSRPNPFTSRARSLLLLAVGGLSFLGIAVFSSMGSNLNGVAESLGPLVRFLATAVSVLITLGFFVFLFRHATTHPLSLVDVLPGAIGAAVVWQLLQTFGAFYVGSVVRNADATNGVFAIVLGLIAWIYLAVVSLLFCVQANVVRVKRLYPRTLLTPFTDDVDLTDADRRAYTSYARAQRNKGFESVDVSFAHNGRYATFRRRRAERKAQRSNGTPLAPGQSRLNGGSPAVRPGPETPTVSEASEASAVEAPAVPEPGAPPTRD